MIDDGVAGDAIDPSAETLSIAERRCGVMHAEEDVLHDIIDVALRADTARDEGTQLGVQLFPRAASRCVDHADAPLSGAQHAGPQHVFPPGLTASIVADATSSSMP